MKNGKRLLAVKEILQKYSDEQHPLSLEEIKNYLENIYHLPNIYRKTINEDLRTLEKEAGMEIFYQHKHGYYCLPSPFSLAEMKIMIDSFAHLPMLDLSFKKQLLQKCSLFFSEKQFSIFKRTTFFQQHSIHYPFLFQLEIALEAISQEKQVMITRKNIKEEILPLFIDRVNEQYYLLYTYPQKTKIYRLLFEHIQEITMSDRNFIPPFSQEEILSYLQETHQAFHGDVQRIEILLKNEEKPLKRWLKNDFPTIEFYRNRAYIRSSHSPRLFATLSAYSEDIEILSPDSFIEDYRHYLQKIIEQYTLHTKKTIVI